jgi:hypothetical protein
MLAMARPLQPFPLIDGVNPLALNAGFIANDSGRVIVGGAQYIVDLQRSLLPPPANCYLLDHHFLKPANRLKVLTESGQQLLKLTGIFRIFCD